MIYKKFIKILVDGLATNKHEKARKKTIKELALFYFDLKNSCLFVFVRG